MMKKQLKQFTLAAPFVGVMTQASAHPGSHVEYSTLVIMQHLFSSPFHVGMILGLGLALVLMIWKITTTSRSE